MTHKKTLFVSALIACIFASGAQAADMKYKEILREDFSLFTLGSEEKPSSNPVNDALQYIPESKTHTPGWQGVEIYQAGGCAYQGAGGRLFTPDINLSRNGGTFRVSFRMKLAAGSPEGYVNVIHNSSVESIYGEKLTEEWKTYTFEMGNGMAADYLCIRGVDKASPGSSQVKVLLDDVVVEIPDPDISSPASLSYGNFDGSSFTAVWSGVAGAEKYELQLYYSGSDGGRVDVEGDFTTASNSYTFSGLEEKWNDYYVSVRAIAGDKVSPWSAPVLIEGLKAPVIREESKVTSSGFRTSWEPVENAYQYELMTYYCHKAGGDEQFYHADTDFSFVRAKDDGSSIDYGFSQMPGWFFGAAELQDGFIGIQGAFAYLGYAAQIESPALDLASSGGKISVELKAKNDDIRTGLAVALYNPFNGDYELADSQEFELSKNWYTVRASLTGGTDGSILALIPTRSGNVYIDDLKVWQNIKTGVEARRLADKTVTQMDRAEISNLDCPEGDYTGYKVRAVGISADKTRWIYSNYTGLRYPGGQSGIESPAAPRDKPLVKINGLNIVVAGIGNVNVYDPAGRMIISAPCNTTIQLPAAGIYIVRTGAGVSKIFVR